MIKRYKAAITYPGNCLCKGGMTSCHQLPNSSHDGNPLRTLAVGVGF